LHAPDRHRRRGIGGGRRAEARLRSASESAVSLATSRSKSCASAPSATDGWSVAVAAGFAIAASLKWIKSMLRPELKCEQTQPISLDNS